MTFLCGSLGVRLPQLAVSPLQNGVERTRAAFAEILGLLQTSARPPTALLQEKGLSV